MYLTIESARCYMAANKFDKCKSCKWTDNVICYIDICRWCVQERPTGCGMHTSSKRDLPAPPLTASAQRIRPLSPLSPEIREDDRNHIILYPEDCTKFPRKDSHD